MFVPCFLTPDPPPKLTFMAYFFCNLNSCYFSFVMFVILISLLALYFCTFPLMFTVLFYIHFKVLFTFLTFPLKFPVILPFSFKVPCTFKLFPLGCPCELLIHCHQLLGMPLYICHFILTFSLWLIHIWFIYRKWKYNRMGRF